MAVAERNIAAVKKIIEKNNKATYAVIEHQLGSLAIKKIKHDSCIYKKFQYVNLNPLCKMKSYLGGIHFLRTRFIIRKLNMKGIKRNFPEGMFKSHKPPLVYATDTN